MKKFCHVMLALIESESVPITSNYPSKTVETNCLDNFEICLLFSRKQQQTFIICCWQYYIRNERTRLPYKNRWNHVSGTILKFVYYLVVNNNKYLLHDVDSIIFGINVLDYPSRTVESKSLRLFCNFNIFCLLYIHINNNKFTIWQIQNCEIQHTRYVLVNFIKIVYFLDKHRR